MTRTFVAQVLEREPELQFIDECFLLRSVEHVAAGFCCETTPSGVHVWKIAFPLYDKRAANISMTFGERLPRPTGFLDLALSEERRAAEFVRLIRPHFEQVKSWLTLGGFLTRIEQLGLKNPWVLRAFVTTLIMLDRPHQAIPILKALDELEVTKCYPGFRGDMDALREALAENNAGRLLLAWEQETRRNLHLTSIEG